MTNMISGHRHLCLQALQAKMCCNAYHDRFLHIRRFPAWEYKRRLSAGWVSVVNIKTNQIFFFLCFLWLCCVGLSSFTFLLYLEDYQDWPTVFRLSEEVVRKPELFFVSTLCVLSKASHLHREEEGNHLLGRDELFWKEENHKINLSYIQMFYCKNIFDALFNLLILLLVFDRWRDTIFQQKKRKFHFQIIMRMRKKKKNTQKQKQKVKWRLSFWNKIISQSIKLWVSEWGQNSWNTWSV